MIAFADAYIISVNNQYCIVCAGDAACAITTVANATYYMFDSHSSDVTGLQNDSGAAVLLHFQAWKKLLAYLHVLRAKLGAIQFEITPYKVQNDLTI